MNEQAIRDAAEAMVRALGYRGAHAYLVKMREDEERLVPAGREPQDHGDSVEPPPFADEGQQRVFIGG